MILKGDVGMGFSWIVVYCDLCCFYFVNFVRELVWIIVSMYLLVKVCCCFFRFIMFILNFIKFNKLFKFKGRKK